MPSCPVEPHPGGRTPARRLGHRAPAPPCWPPCRRARCPGVRGRSSRRPCGSPQGRPRAVQDSPCGAPCSLRLRRFSSGGPAARRRPCPSVPSCSSRARSAASSARTEAGRVAEAVMGLEGKAGGDGRSAPRFSSARDSAPTDTASASAAPGERASAGRRPPMLSATFMVGSPFGDSGRGDGSSRMGERSGPAMGEFVRVSGRIQLVFPVKRRRRPVP